MRIIKQLFLLLFILTIQGCNITYLNSSYTSKEKITIIRANTGRFNLIMGRRSKEIIRLCNLARKNPTLLKKYVEIKYGKEYSERKGITNLKESKRLKDVPLLRPSYLLTISAISHALISGVISQIGHQGFPLRVYLTGNFNCFIPYVPCGENCYYGEYKAINLFMGWMESSGHKSNIMNDEFYRIGMGGFIHFSKYKYNMVQNFCGPKILDLFIRPKQVFKNKKLQ